VTHVVSDARRILMSKVVAESGAFVFGRRTYEIADGWGGRHPVNGVPLEKLSVSDGPHATRRVSIQ
jgi:hypothetical protein